tara:strand:- start:9430 stop:10338 length:909 start_codon:yes stop_codon:yes gene_type:complete
MELDKLFCIPEKDWYEIISWAQIAYDKDKNEISGLATAVPNKDGIYTIRDVEILKQENTGTNTELDGDAVADYKMRYAMKYKNPGIKFVWWHSHHTMGAFWSGTDENEINAWKNESFSLALVVNLKQEYKFRVSLWKASGLEIEQHYDINLNIIRKDGINVTSNMEKKYKELCEDKVSNVISYNGYNRANITQNNLWNSHLHDKMTMKDKAYHKQTKEALEEIVDKFMEGETTLPKFKKSLKSVQAMLDQHKITDYKIVIPEGNKQEVIDMFQFQWDLELLEYKDELRKHNYEMEEHYGWYN